jgi:hypothetical protein
MDDIVIFVKTKKQFCKAKKKLKQILDALKLKCAKRKTKMGILTREFHFLGINFRINARLSSKAKGNPLINSAVAQTQHSQFQVNTALHSRSCVRATDKILVMREGAVHPANAQCYLSRWAAWWSRTASPINKTDCLLPWLQHAFVRQPTIAWLASGILSLQY